MLPENRIPTYPGEILLEEFLNPLALSQVAFAGHIGPFKALTKLYMASEVSLQRLPGCLRRLLGQLRSSG